MQRLEPVIGQWYKRPGRNPFEVVAIDEPGLTVELQYFDGTVDELDRESWDYAYIETVEAPEDYSGSLDLSKLDYAAKVDDVTHQVWDDPLNYLDTVDA